MNSWLFNARLTDNNMQQNKREWTGRTCMLAQTIIQQAVQTAYLYAGAGGEQARRRGRGAASRHAVVAHHRHQRRARACAVHAQLARINRLTTVNIGTNHEQSEQQNAERTGYQCGVQAAVADDWPCSWPASSW